MADTITKRRCLCFRLRTLLIVITVAGPVLGYGWRSWVTQDVHDGVYDCVQLTNHCYTDCSGSSEVRPFLMRWQYRLVGDERLG